MNKNSDKKGLILSLVGAVVFAATFMFILLPLTQSAENLRFETQTLQDEIDLLEMQLEKLPEYELLTEQNKEYAREQLNHYPAYVSEEDTIIWVLELEEMSQGTIASVSFTEPITVSAFNGYASVGGDEVLTSMTSFVKQSTLDGVFAYDGMKEAFDYIYNYDDRTSIDTVSMTYDATTAQLAVNLSVSKYYIEYAEAEYQPLPIPQVPIGNPNPFAVLLSGVDEE